MRYRISLMSLALFLTLLPIATIAASNWEVSAAGGVNWMSASNATLNISSYEVDTVATQHSVVNGTWKVGVGYNFFSKMAAKRNYLNDLLVELNLYHSATTVSGLVDQYESTEFNNYTFQAPVSSTRLMLDFKPNLVSHGAFSSYAILGLGSAWNSMAYNEAVANPNIAPNSYTQLDSGDTFRAAYDLGFGLCDNLTQQLSLSLEYLYSYLGAVHSSNMNNSGIAVAKAPQFTLQNQSLMLAVNWSF